MPTLTAISAVVVGCSVEDVVAIVLRAFKVYELEAMRESAGDAGGGGDAGGVGQPTSEGATPGDTYRIGIPTALMIRPGIPDKTFSERGLVNFGNGLRGSRLARHHTITVHVTHSEEATL